MLHELTTSLGDPPWPRVQLDERAGIKSVLATPSLILGQGEGLTTNGAAVVPTIHAEFVLLAQLGLVAGGQAWFVTSRTPKSLNSEKVAVLDHPSDRTPRSSERFSSVTHYHEKAPHILPSTGSVHGHVKLPASGCCAVSLLVANWDAPPLSLSIHCRVPPGRPRCRCLSRTSHPEGAPLKTEREDVDIVAAYKRRGELQTAAAVCRDGPQDREESARLEDPPPASWVPIGLTSLLA